MLTTAVAVAAFFASSVHAQTATNSSTTPGAGSAAASASATSVTSTGGSARTETVRSYDYHQSTGKEDKKVRNRGNSYSPGPARDRGAPDPELEAEAFETPGYLEEPWVPAMRKLPYECTLADGETGCCDYKCKPLEGDQCAPGPSTGKYVPQTWLLEAGFESCDAKVSMFYDASIDCDKAIPPYGECGANATPFACAYGTACVARDIYKAKCLPICGERYPQGLLSPNMARFWRNTMGAGCKLTPRSVQPLGSYSTQRRRTGTPFGIGVPNAKLPSSRENRKRKINTSRNARVHVGYVRKGEYNIVYPACLPSKIIRVAPGTPGGVPTPDMPTPGPGGEMGPVTAANADADEKRRIKLAAQINGISHVYNELQRAGAAPDDAADTYPQVWQGASERGYKIPSFTEICKTYQSEFLSEAERESLDLSSFAGYYEAGSPVIVTTAMGWSASQWAIAGIYFEDLLAARPMAVLPDPELCVAEQPESAMYYARRQMRYMGRSLVSTIVKPSAAEYTQIIGVADSTSFTGAPAWLQDVGQQDRCYFTDAENPAADIIGQTSAALALLAKYFTDSPYAEPGDKELADIFLARAKLAYEVATVQLNTFGENTSVCTASDLTKSNCIGDYNETCDCTCGTEEGQLGYSVMGPCLLYFNIKGAAQQLFGAAAALWDFTGDPAYYQDANDLYTAYFNKKNESDPDSVGTTAQFGGFTFLWNWNNVWTQGVITLAASKRPTPAGITGNTKEDWRTELRTAVQFWSVCYRDGDFFGSDFCKKTPDGYAYPTIVPRGNTAVSYSAVCTAGIYHMLQYDDVESADMLDARCFMDGQLGYLTNHKCAPGSQPDNATCLTGTEEGFSYTVGLGTFFPRKPLDYAAEYPDYDEPDVPAPNTLCGGTVGGAFIQDPSNGTDYHVDDKNDFFQNEAAQDYTASMMCAFGGYAAIQSTLLAECAATGTVPRTVFTGR